MRALIVHCHPSPESFTAAVRDTVLERLAAAGAEVRVIDLYARGFNPVLSRGEWEGYLDAPANADVVAEDVAALRWADTLIFVYPTWWYGLPAMLKGWLDRVLLPEVAFEMPKAQGETIKPGLTHITGLAVFTTCGASWWLTRFVGAPGRRTLLRGVGLLCHRRHRTAFAALYLMDTVDAGARRKHLARVAAKTDRLVVRVRPLQTPRAATDGATA
jgi:putative NADPH-quinone reductase